MKYNEYKLRRCTVQDVAQIYNLQNLIIDELADKDILRKNTRDMFEVCTREPNETLGIFEGETIIALGIMFDAKGTEEDLSVSLVQHSVDRPINFKLVLVRKECRGNGFQKALMWLLEKYAYLQGYTHMCTTVSGNNIYSLRNIIESGYMYDCDVIKYGGLERKLYVKNIYNSVNDFNKMILRNIGSWEEKHEKNGLILEGINFERCFQGEISIATTGDILEYEDIYSGEIYYGMFVKNYNRQVLIYIPCTKKLKLVDFSIQIDGMKLRNVWVNSIGGI